MAPENDSQSNHSNPKILKPAEIKLEELHKEAITKSQQAKQAHLEKAIKQLNDIKLQDKKQKPKA